MRTFAIVTAAALLSGCAGSAGMRAPELSPQEIRQDLLSHRSTVWKDSSSIREARIGQAYSCPWWHGDFSAPRTCVCIESNAKNSFGGYSGMQKYIAIYRGPTMVSLERWVEDDLCGSLEPFPELNGDYVAAATTQPKKPRG